MRRCIFSSTVGWLLISALMLLPASATALTYVAGELVVGMNDGQTIDLVETRFEIVLTQNLPNLNVYLVNSSYGVDLLSLAEQIMELPEVRFCHPNYLIDPLQPVQTSLPVSDAPGGSGYYEQTVTESLELSTVHGVTEGAEAMVGIIDGGINFDHPALLGAAFTGYDYVDNDENATDEPGGRNSGHGTFVAGVIHLIAPQADLVAYRVTDLEGSSNGYLVAEAIMQAVADGCNILNLSMVTLAEHLALSDAIEFAREQGVLVVVAAGNGHTADAHYPASDINAMAVAAIDTLNLLADFSSFGPHIDVCAPGTEICAPYLNEEYVWWGGTSFASPIVAAQAALLLSYSPGISGDSIRSLIISTAKDLDALNPDYAGQLGGGLVDPVASLTALRGSAEVLLVPSDYETIQSAIDAALHGDTIMVAAGVYVENIYFNGKAVILTSIEGPTMTILKPANTSMSTVTIRQTFPGSPTLNGFGLTGATDARALDIDANWTVTVTNNIIYDNHRDSLYGDVVYIYGTSAVFARNIFYGNTGRSSLALKPWGSGVNVLVSNNVFDDNENGILLLGSSVYGRDLDCEIVNNVFSRTVASALFTDPGTIYEGVAKRCDNNMFWNNGVDIGPEAAPEGAYSLFDDPEFMAPDFREYHALPGSPVIDAGVTDTSFYDDDGTVGDIGVYPVFKNVYPIMTEFLMDGIVPGVEPVTVLPELSWAIFEIDQGSQTQYHIQVSSDQGWAVAEMWDSGPIGSSSTTVSYGGSALSKFTTYYLRLRVGNATDWGGWRYFEFIASVPTVYVPGDFTTIQEAVDWMDLIDTIMVRPGVYTENITIGQGAVVLISEAGALSTVIEPASSLSTIIIDSADQVEINGFTFRGTTNAIDFSYAVYAVNSVQVRLINNRVVGTSRYGMRMKDVDDMLVKGNYFEANRLRDLSVYEGGSCLVDSNRFVRNWDSNSAVSVSYCEQIEIRRSVFAFCRGQEALTVKSHYSTVLTNNTFYKNVEYGLFARSPNGTLLNSIFVGNGSSGFDITNLSDIGIWEVNYLNSYQNGRSSYLYQIDWPEVMDSVDPMFIDSIDGTCQLRPLSPMIDAGDPRSEYNDPDGSRSDIGAIPYSSDLLPSAIAVQIAPQDSRGFVVSLVPEFSWEYTDIGATPQQQVQIQVGAVGDWTLDQKWDSGPVVQTARTITYAGSPLTDGETYYVRVRVNNGTKWGAWRKQQFTIRLSPVLHVPSTFATIQAAADYAVDGDTIWVGPGTYTEFVKIESKNLALISTDGPDVTIIKPPSYEITATLEIRNASLGTFVLEGFTIEGSRHSCWFYSGGGTIRGNKFINADFYGLSVTGTKGVPIQIIDNLFERNLLGLATDHCSAGGTITGNTFTNNHNQKDYVYLARLGGGAGLKRSSNFEISNNLFAKNSADKGAGMYIVGCDSLSIHNNTFFANRSLGTDDGVIYVKDSLSLVDFRNNIVANSIDGSDVWYQLPGENNLSKFEYNVFFGNAGQAFHNISIGRGTILADPMFVDPAAWDLNLSEFSPCIDAGDPDDKFKDADGTRADMGAFEFDLANATLAIPLHLNLGEENMKGVVSQTPTFYWTSFVPSGSQTAFEIEVGTDLLWDVAENWSPGEVATSDSFIVYDGLTLVGGSEYYYRVRLYNGTDWGPWRGGWFYKNTTPVASGDVSIIPWFYSGYAPSCRLISRFSDGDNDSLKYDFEIYSDSELTNLHSSFLSLLDSSTASLGNVDTDTWYWWRARVFDGFEYSQWTVPYEFKTMPSFGQMLLSNSDETTVPCNQPIEFKISLNNDIDRVMAAFDNAWQVYSPDGGLLEFVTAEWDYSSFDWDQAFLIQGDYGGVVRTYSGVHNYTSADTVSFYAKKHTRAAGFPPLREEPGWIITTKVSCDDIGATVCVDTSNVKRYAYDPYTWLYYDTIDGATEAIQGIPQWGGPYCFEISACCEGPRGDVNNDGTNGNLADITALINFVYLGGTAPACYEEANVNGDIDQKINLADITRLIDYVYISKLEPPGCGEFMLTPASKSVVNNDVTLTSYYNDGKTIIVMEATEDLRGVHLQLSGTRRTTPTKEAGDELDLVFRYAQDSLLTLALFDADGPGLVRKGRQSLVSLNGQFIIVGAEAVNLNHQTIYPNVTSKEGEAGLPTEFSLGRNYPNPFNPSTTIKFSLARAVNVRLELFNVLGQTVRVLTDQPMLAGNHEVVWDGKCNQGKLVASGVYFYRLRAGDYVESRRMLLIK